MPQAEEMIEQTPEARRAAQQEKHRPGFDDVVWFRMDIGRRQNADPRWVLPLICRRGGVTKNEVGAIRIAPNETLFEIHPAAAQRFLQSIKRTAGKDDNDVTIEPAAGGPAHGAAPGGPQRHRRGGPPARGRPGPRH
jgi:ATP-dependent RNA helicase DeaD